MFTAPSITLACVWPIVEPSRSLVFVVVPTDGGNQFALEGPDPENQNAWTRKPLTREQIKSEAARASLMAVPVTGPRVPRAGRARPRPPAHDTSRRLACDASPVHMRHDADGAVLDRSRKTRTIPPSIRRTLAARDTSCRFRGCTSRRCDAHHLEHWADGGATRLDKRVLLCRRHHRAVHEGGFGGARGRDPWECPVSTV